jgi:hypothetical protein
MTKDPWTKLITKLAREIRRDGWKVRFDVPLGGRRVGCINYETRTIVIDDPVPHQAFLTLCHEDGHRQAFVYWGATSEANFEKLCPVRTFRETQAKVFGWRTCQRYTKLISLKTWIAENNEYENND